MHRSPRPAAAENQERWVVSWADLMTLLLAFFVVMYSMSTIDADKRRQASESIVTAFGGTIRSAPAPATGGAPVSPEPKPAARPSVNPAQPPTRVIERRVLVEVPASTSLPTPSPAETEAVQRSGPDEDAVSGGKAAPKRMLKADDMARVAREIRDALDSLIEQGAVEVTDYDNRMEIEIRSNLLFASGSADLTSQARPLLERVGARLTPMENPIRVEGFTDNVPIRSRYPSNWELAAMRAAGVTRRLEELGVSAAQLSSVGYGEQRPIADNETAEGRARNRRVVIVVMIDSSS